MVNEKLLRLLLFAGVAVLHVILILFLAFNVKVASREENENARIMKLADLAEAPPPPSLESIPRVEAIAETMIETDTLPEQHIVAAGQINLSGSFDDYLPAHRVSVNPFFDPEKLAAEIGYPPIARRSGIEGRVILELFVDRTGLVQQIRVLQENPPGRGFGEAALRAFSGRRGSPAMANGEPVSCRYRYPVSFRLN
jgi:protein TonB